MLRFYINQNLRIKLLVPVTVILIVSFLLLSFSVSGIQGKLLKKMGAQLGARLESSDEAMQKDFSLVHNHSRQIMTTMAQSSSKDLTLYTRQVLDNEKNQIAKEWETQLRKNAESLVSTVV